jgi:hypothetical protein
VKAPVGFGARAQLSAHEFCFCFGMRMNGQTALRRTTPVTQ